MEPLDENQPTLCRDCMTEIAPPSAKQTSTPHQDCNHNRLLSHAELRTLSIAHVDCDAFYATVEKRDNPELTKKPLIIGGGGQRGVVSTACYIARMNGVHSAMPMFKARKLCPDAVILPPNMKKYSKVSKEIRSKMLSLTPLVEPISIDEAFMDFSGTERLHGTYAAKLLANMAKEIEAEIGITVSIGLAPNKFLAKIASDMNKPRGFTIVGEQEKQEFLASLPITKIYGIGKKTAARMNKDGLSMISQIQTMDASILAKRYGEVGLRLHRLAMGDDTRPIKSKRETKSISSERTFRKDINIREDLEKLLWKLAENVSLELKTKQMAGKTITLKLKTSTHRIITRSRTIDQPTQLAETLFEVGADLLKPLSDGTPYRLIGLGVSQFGNLEDADIPDLIEPERTKKAEIEKTMDSLRKKFGKSTIIKGRSIE
ncbi:DNA polymerase IV [Kordiimonas sp. SCSIO 12610]|nr:DNA polymerase IV [Kordiimonas sp. SCSIO 12610]